MNDDANNELIEVVTKGSGGVHLNDTQRQRIAPITSESEDADFRDTQVRDREEYARLLAPKSSHH